MAVNVSDLPAKYQAQAMRKYIEQEQRRGRTPSASPEQPGGSKPSKYHNIQTERITENGTEIHFDSQKEARRYDELLLDLKTGQIRDLRLQPQFTLQESFKTHDGKRVQAIRYVADFSYIEHELLVVEDVKSTVTKTSTYQIKRKMMQERLGLEIREV